MGGVHRSGAGTTLWRCTVGVAYVILRKDLSAMRMRLLVLLILHDSVVKEITVNPKSWIDTARKDILQPLFALSCLTLRPRPPAELSASWFRNAFGGWCYMAHATGGLSKDQRVFTRCTWRIVDEASSSL